MVQRLHFIAPRFAARMLGPIKQVPTGIEFSFALSGEDIDAVGLRGTHLQPDREIKARLTQKLSPKPATSWLGKALQWAWPKTLKTTFTMAHLRGWVNDVHDTRQLLHPSQSPERYQLFAPLTIMRPALKPFLQVLPQELAPYQAALQHATGGEWARFHVVHNGWGRVIGYHQSTGIYPPRLGEYQREVDLTNAEASAVAEKQAAGKGSPFEFIVPTASFEPPAGE